MSLVLGVDVGSQSIKAVIVDEGGVVVSSGSAPLTMVHEHDGWADQDPLAYCTALRDAVRAAAEGVQAERVVAMGLGSQVDGVVACDADGTPLRSAIIWLDKRATKECDQLVSAVGSERLAERTGLVADASHSAPKMMWIRENEPQSLAAVGNARSRRIVCAASSFGITCPGCRECVVDDGVRRGKGRLRHRAV